MITNAKFRSPLPGIEEEGRDCIMCDAEIIDRGRGPELKGTRITVYRIMDFLKYGCSHREICNQLDITEAQCTVALEYIKTHEDILEKKYQQILECVNQGNPPWIEERRARTLEELRRRIIERQ